MITGALIDWHNIDSMWAMVSTGCQRASALSTESGIDCQQIGAQNESTNQAFVGENTQTRRMSGKVHVRGMAPGRRIWSGATVPFDGCWRSACGQSTILLCMIIVDRSERARENIRTVNAWRCC